MAEKTIYELYDWRDTICVSHYPFPTENVEDKDLINYIGLEEENLRKNKKAIYVHIPFCEKICSFCPFNKVLKQEEQVEKYIEAIKKEIELYAETPYCKTSQFAAVNFGGGTPSCLKKEQIVEIVIWLKSHMNLTDDVVISMEGSTSNFTEEKLKAVFEAGVNRVSFGIQTFNQRLRDIMGLKETSTRCKELLANARKIGFQNICIDFIYNQPGQSMEDWKEDIQYAIDAQIDHITLFALCMVPGTKLQKQIVDGTVPSVGHQNDEIDMFVEARKMLREAGYIQYSIWDFAKPGKIDVNPLIYYNRQEDLLGMGPAAFGYVNCFMYINKGKLPDYFSTLENGKLPILVGKKADKMDQMRGMMSKGLRNYSVDKKLFREMFDCNPEDVFPEEIKRLTEDNLLEITDDEVRLSDRGGVWGNNVSKEFFEKPETFEWRQSLAKGKMPKPEEVPENGVDYTQFGWEKDVKELFERLLERKPMFIREKARKDIGNMAAGFAKEEERTVINEHDVIIATMKDTPAPFRPTAINGFKMLGVNVDQYMDELKRI